MDEESERQVFIGGIQKFSKDRDFAKFIEKEIPNYNELVTGVCKKRQATAIIVRLHNAEAKAAFVSLLEGKMYKNRGLKLKRQDPPIHVKKFIPLDKLLQQKAPTSKKPTEEEIKEEMDKSLKDKLIPYHNVPYDEQIKKKEEFLKGVFKKYTKRVQREVDIGHEPFLPNWMTQYWATLKPEDIQENNQPKVEEVDQEENQDAEKEEENKESFEKFKLP